MAEGFGKGMLIGIIAGAIGGVLFAPKSGKETRDDIKNTAMDIKDDLMDEIGDVKSLTKRKYNQAVSKITAGYKEAKKLTPSQAKEISKILEDSFDKIEEAIKKEG